MEHGGNFDQVFERTLFFLSGHEAFSTMCVLKNDLTPVIRLFNLTVIAVAATPDDERNYGVEGWR